MAFGGPYDTEADFNGFLLAQLDPHPARDHSRLPELRFTHADLGPHNILVENGQRGL